MSIVEFRHLRSEPCGHMNAIRDMSNRYGFFERCGIKVGPHRSGHLPVKRGHRVRSLRELQSEHCHAKFLAGILRIFLSETHELLRRQTKLTGKRSQMFVDKFRNKSVVTRGNRSVGCEDYLACDARCCFRKRDALFQHPISNGFENRECAMPFVQVKDSGCYAHGFECTKSSDAQQ